MAATIRIHCSHQLKHAVPLVNEALEWANELNKLFRHPIARLDGRDVELSWDRATDIEVSPDQRFKLQVFVRAVALHWCGAEIETEPLRDGETQSYEYHIDYQDGWVRHGRLDRTA